MFNKTYINFYIIKNTKENEKNNIKIIKKDNYYRC